MKRLTAFVTAVCLWASVLAAPAPLTACVQTDAQIAADGNAIAQACLSIAAIEQTENPALAANLTTAAKSLEALTANWQTGNSTAILASAAAALQIILAAIPQTALIAPLVPIAFAAIEVLLANIGAKVGGVNVKAIAPGWYTGAQIPHRLGRDASGDFKAAWNSTAKANPALAKAAIK